MIKKIVKVSLLGMMVVTFSLPVFAGQHEHKNGHHGMNFDANGDGQITSKEYSDAFMKRFHRADTNNDGVLDRDEVKKVRNRMKHMKSKYKSDHKS